MITYSNDQQRVIDERGHNLLVTAAAGSGKTSVLVERIIKKITDLDAVDGIVPTVSTRAYIVYGGQISESRISISGKNGYYFQITDDLVTRGRGLNFLDDDYTTWVCLVSQDVVDEFFFARDPIGETIYVSGLPFEIVGLMDEDSGGGIAAILSGQPDVLIPYTTAMRLNSTNVVTSFTVHMADGYTSSEVQEILDSMQGACATCMFIGHEGNHFVISGSPTNISAQIVFAMMRYPIVRDIIKTCAERFDELNEECGDGVRDIKMDHLIEKNSGNKGN